jgi:mannose-6-phosphate isomerase-like protein (cupin superfamily)
MDRPGQRRQKGEVAMGGTREKQGTVRYDVGDYEERPWGNWRVVDAADTFITKRVELKPGHRLSLQYHQHRSEHWVIVGGLGEALVDDTSREVRPGDYVVIPCGAVHRIQNTGDAMLVFVEVQFGEILDEKDIKRLSDDYARS